MACPCDPAIGSDAPGPQRISQRVDAPLAERVDLPLPQTRGEKRVFQRVVRFLERQAIGGRQRLQIQMLQPAGLFFGRVRASPQNPLLHFRGVDGFVVRGSASSGGRFEIRAVCKDREVRITGLEEVAS